MSDKIQFISVEEYFDAQPALIQQKLNEIKKCILTIAPGATELLNYNLPANSLIKGGKRAEHIMIAGYKNHVRLYPILITMEHFDSELNDYKNRKGAVQFPLNKLLPKTLIETMIK